MFSSKIGMIFLYVVAALLLVAFLVMLVSICKDAKRKRKKTFKKSLQNAKAKHEIVIIDMDEKKVDKYLPYSQASKQTSMPLEAFLMRFDKINADKLRIWFDHIARSKSSKKVNKIEIIMYNEKNEKRVYLLESLKYQIDPKRYYIDFLDVTDSVATLRRVNAKHINKSVDDFISEVNNKNTLVGENSSAFVSVIKYKEFDYSKNESFNDYRGLLDDAIYKKISSIIDESDYLSKSNAGTFLLYSTNILKAKKYKKHLKSIMLKASGLYEIDRHRYTYTVTLVAGYKKIDVNDPFTKDVILECESASNKALSKGFLAERIQEFDEQTKKEFELATNKSIIIDKVIQKAIFDIGFIPIINRIEKVVDCYYIKTIVPHSLNMGYTDFIHLVRNRNYTFQYYALIFEKILANPTYYSKKLILSFDNADLNEALRAYRSKDEFKSINITLFLEFPNRLLTNNETNLLLLSMNKAVSEDKLEFGININSLNTFYLNQDIYLSSKYLLLSSQRVYNSLTNHQVELDLEACLKEAKNFYLKVLAIDVSTLAMYEMLAFHDVNFIGGNLFNKQIEDEKITDRLFLNSLNELDSKKY